MDRAHGHLPKILPLAQLAARVLEWQAAGKRVVLCHGVFDLLHPGHIRHFEAARREGDLLVVTITPDRHVNKGPGRPVFSQQLRAEVIASLTQVDLVAINEWPTAAKTIRQIKPDVYVKGSDYKDHAADVTGGIVDEVRAVEQAGGRVVYTDEATFSSSSLANSCLDLYPRETADFLREFRARTPGSAIQAGIDRVAGCRALVIGDAIIDEYHYCTPLGKSPKGDVINTKFLSEERFAGGVLAAVNHVASVCEQVDLVTVLGKHPGHETFVRRHLHANVRPTFFTNGQRPTVVKRRFVEPVYMRKLFEVSFLEEAVPDAGQDEMYAHLEQALPAYDLVLVADFGHGALGPTLIDLICRKARFLAVNAQTNSANMGFNLITKYPRADYVCVDEPEARLALQDRSGDLAGLIPQLHHRLEAPWVAVTRGRQGCIVSHRETGMWTIPAFTANIVDTIGAGDAFLALTAPCVAVGMPMEQVGFVGNAAGAMHVGVVGNRTTVEKIPLLKFMTTLLK